MEVSNASLYDGGSALAEACLMAVRAHRKSKSQRILVPTTRASELPQGGAWPPPAGQGVRFEELPCARRATSSVADLEKYEGEDITAIVIQQPNFFGVLEDVDAITDWAHANGAMVIALGESDCRSRILKPPGEWGAKGADIACRRRPAARRAAVLGRSVLRLPHHAHGTRAPDAGPHRRPHGRPGRQARASR